MKTWKPQVSLSEQISRQPRLVWLLALLALLSLAPQCYGSLPPLPASPVGPSLRIGLFIPTGGDLATVGQAARSGIILAFDEWNNRGGLLGHRLEWLIYDTKCDFEAAQQAARQALEEGLQLFIGPICSEAAIGAALSIDDSNQASNEASDALMISPTATHPLVTVDHQGRTRSAVFRVSYSYMVQAQAAARFARDHLGVSRAALLAQSGDDYSTGLTSLFAQQFRAEGGQIVYQATSTLNTENLAAILADIRQAEAELIYLPGTPEIVNQVAGNLHETLSARSTTSTGANLLLLGSDSWESDRLDLILAENSYFPVHYISAVDQAIVQDWVSGYKAVYSVEPTTLAVLSYDAANILAQAIAETGSFQPAAITATLEKNAFESITGPIRFDRCHNPVKPVPFVRIQDNGLVYVTSIAGMPEEKVTD